ncbi:glycoside hydrolase family 11 protein [Ruminococcus sp.]|uniref:glycoside hydrolase family 11 protein n=1 Tax=Ruminococcus sp. TaxID=41978 RepID=UPI0025DA6903|nr:glycoside hydrolase family 11 protein [Ruminococcus sp.]
MNNKFFKRASAAAMSLVISTLSMPISAYAADRQIIGHTPDGYYYEFWNMNSSGETEMKTDENGAFSCVWNGIENVLFRTGRNLGSVLSWKDYDDIKYEYDVDYAPKGNSYMCVYGWTEKPLVEYYIVDAWGDWRPPGTEKPVAEINVDGNDYEVYSLTKGNQMSILGPTSFKQYWSVRKENGASIDEKRNLTGEISVSDHFAAWEKAGLELGDLYDVTFNIEGYKSSGEATVNKAKLTFGDSDSWKQTNVETTVTETSTQTTTSTSISTKTETTTTEVTVPSVSTQPVEPDSDGSYFKDKFSRWFKIGTSASTYDILSCGSFIKDNFNSITPENELKPDSILDQEASQKLGNNVNPQVNLKNADTVLKFCEENGISLRGQTFVWYSQTPEWFFRENFSSNGALVSKEVMDQRLENFIKNTFEALKEQYPDLKIAAYDVCNEIFVNDGGGLRDGNNSKWAKIYGDSDYITNAFKYARKYAPSECKLFLNDYNEYLPAKTKDICQMAMSLKKIGVIDGIGMQSHLDTKFPDMETYEMALEEFISTGLEIQITELDITCTNYDEQANAYYDVFKLAMNNSEQITNLTVWGLNDARSWRSDMNPCLFWNGFKPKPAYEKILTLADSFYDHENSSNPWGDANLDKNVDIADSVTIMQSLANPSKYTMDKEGSSFADVNLKGNGITNADALTIQKYLLGLIKNLPESYVPKKEAVSTTAAETTVTAETTTSVKTTTVKETSAKTSTEETTSTPDTTTKIAVDKTDKTFEVGNGVSQCKGIDEDGYDYEIWLDNSMDGVGSMTLGKDGAFTAEWDVRKTQGSFLSQSGKYFDGNKKAVNYTRLNFDYDVDFSVEEAGNTHFGIYGWLKDPLVEYYVIEDWKNWRPSNYDQIKTVVIDGAEYEIFCQSVTGPCILSNSQTFKRYYSVRKEPRKSGNVDLLKHFNAWENAGWDVGNLYQASFSVDAWQSAGKIDVKKLTIN